MDVYVRTIVQPGNPPLRSSEVQHKIIDWNDSSDRKWLMNHLHWAMNNKKPVTLEQANGYHRTVTEMFRESN